LAIEERESHFEHPITKSIFEPKQAVNVILLGKISFSNKSI
jgi:hypothetical protein